MGSRVTSFGFLYPNQSYRTRSASFQNLHLNCVRIQMNRLLQKRELRLPACVRGPICLYIDVPILYINIYIHVQWQCNSLYDGGRGNLHVAGNSINNFRATCESCRCGLRHSIQYIYMHYRHDSLFFEARKQFYIETTTTKTAIANQATINQSIHKRSSINVIELNRTETFLTPCTHSIVRKPPTTQKCVKRSKLNHFPRLIGTLN